MQEPTKIKVAKYNSDTAYPKKRHKLTSPGLKA